MKQNCYFVTTAVVALFAAGACAACSLSPNLAGVAAEAALTAVQSEHGVSRNLIAKRISEEGDSLNLNARSKSDDGALQNRAPGPRTDESVPYNQVAAARSAERSFEHREPPPKHLVAVKSCKDLERERPVAG